MYQVACQCGYKTEVQLAQAGSSVECVGCKKSLEVPRASQLKRSSGDENPFLNAVQRLSQAVTDRSKPFDGECQKCRERTASKKRRVTYKYLLKRDVSHHGGLVPSFHPLKPGIALVVGAAEEQWNEVRFPLLLCESCHDEFSRKVAVSGLTSASKKLLIALVLIPVVLAILALSLVMPFVGIPGVLLVIGMAIRQFARKKGNPYLMATLQRIPLIKEAIYPEDEFELYIGEPQEYVAKIPS